MYSSLCIPIHKTERMPVACVCVCVRVCCVLAYSHAFSPSIQPSPPSIFNSMKYTSKRCHAELTRTHVHLLTNTNIHLYAHMRPIHAYKKIRHYNLKLSEPSKKKTYETNEADFNRRFLTRAIVNQNDQNSIFIKSPVASIIPRQNSSKSE